MEPKSSLPYSQGPAIIIITIIINTETDFTVIYM